MAKKEKSYAYPRTISSIPYASFIKINKYSYDEGLKKIGMNQKDALGSIQNSGLVKEVADSLAKSANSLYSNGMNKFSNKDEEAAIESLRRNTKLSQFRKGNKNIVREKVGQGAWKLVDNRTNAEIAEKIEFEGRYVNGKREKTTLQETLNRKAEVQKFRDAGYTRAYVDLALPNEFQYQYGANWSNVFKLGTMALLADDPKAMGRNMAGGALAGGLFGGTKGALSQIGGDNKILANIGSGMGKGAKKAGDLFNVNSSIVDPTNIAGLAGMAPNENAIQFFKKMEFRQFELNFEFASRNENESQTIQDILKWFKIGMHPASKDPLGSGSGVLLGFPDVFVLQPQFVPVEKGEALPSVNHKMMPKTKLCALQGMNVNATPFGSVNTIFDGTIPLITVTLRFAELTALTRADFESDEYL
tara:strand:- start:672 stop:1922 length:1251 start_codon:yes stop_codon:yes gene_type:complete